MKTVLMWLLALVVIYIIFLILGLIGCLCKGTMGFRNGSLVAIDSNGQVQKSLSWNEGWFNSTAKPTEEEIKQIDEKYQQERSDKAAWLCFAALGSFILGWLTGKPQFHTVGVCLVVGAFVWDYKTAATALFMWYVIVPALIVMGIVGLFKRN